ncbi:MAG: phage tail fiber protein, partial [Candidatus Nanopelagicales bacterium]
MAITTATYTGNGSTTLYSFTFPYLQTADVKVKVNGILKADTIDYNFANATTIQFVTAPANGAAISIYRATDIEDAAATFYPGSSIRAQDLNNNFDQGLYFDQEIGDRYLDKYNNPEFKDILDMNGYRIINLGNPINANDATNKGWVEDQFDGDTNSNLIYNDKPRDTVIFGAGTQSATAYRIISQGNFSGAPGSIGIARNNNTPTSSAEIGSLHYLTSAHESVAQIKVARDGGTWTPSSPGFVGSYPTAMSFFTTPNGGANAVERIKITSDGKIGINTSTPTEQLTVDGNIEVKGSLKFEGSTDNGFETTLAVVDPTFDRTITLPDVTGTVITDADTGTVTSTMIANNTIVNADINSSAAIAGTKINPDFGSQSITTLGSTTSASFIPSATIAIPTQGLYEAAANSIGLSTNGIGRLVINGSGDITTGSWKGSVIDAAYLDASLVSTSDTGTVTSTMIANGTIVNADVNASAAIAGTKISPDFGSQAITTTSISTAASFIPSATIATPTNGLYEAAANSIGLSTNSTERLRIGANGEIGLSGANYGTSGQVLTSAGSGAAPTWTTPPAGTADKIEEGNSSAEVIDTGSNGRFVVTTEGLERMRLDSSGRLGLGTSSPAYNAHITNNGAAGTLSLHGSSGVGYLIMGNADTASGPLVVYSANQVLAIAKGDSFSSAGGGTLTEFVRIDSSGRVGIGTTSPSTRLHVVGTDNETLRLDTASTYNTSINWYNNGVIKWSTQALGDGTNAYRFYNFTTNSEALRIDSSGRLLVGTSSTSESTTAVLQGRPG